MLPIEILQRIATYLPAHAAAAFAFSCKTMHHILGQQYWSALSIRDADGEAPNPEKLAFLAMLEKDLPTYRLCHCCAILSCQT